MVGHISDNAEAIDSRGKLDIGTLRTLRTSSIVCNTYAHHARTHVLGEGLKRVRSDLSVLVPVPAASAMLPRDARSLRRAAQRDTTRRGPITPAQVARRKRRPSHSRRQRKRHRQALTAAATADALYFAGGRGRSLEISPSDLLLVRRAVREGWATPQDVCDAIVAQLIKDLPTATGRRVNAIGRFVVDAERCDVDARLAAIDAVFDSRPVGGAGAVDAVRDPKTVGTGLAPSDCRVAEPELLDVSRGKVAAGEPLTLAHLRLTHRKGGQ